MCAVSLFDEWISAHCTYFTATLHVPIRINTLVFVFDISDFDRLHNWLLSPFRSRSVCWVAEQHCTSRIAWTPSTCYSYRLYSLHRLSVSASHQRFCLYEHIIMAPWNASKLLVPGLTDPIKRAQKHTVAHADKKTLQMLRHSGA